MEFNWSTIAWIAGLLFVYIFGLLEGRSKGYKKRKAEEQQERTAQPSPPPAETVTVKVDDPGLLRVRNEKGGLTLDLDGKRVDPGLLSSDQRKRLIEILGVMRPWLEGRSAPANAASPATRSATADQPAPTSFTPVSPAPAAQAAPGARATSPRTPVIAKEDRPSAPSNSIVGQIDSVLQARLAGTALEERGVFLTQSPEGTVNVYVGLTRYNGVDEVPDPEIKAAIRAAISEWEDKYTPGL